MNAPQDLALWEFVASALLEEGPRLFAGVPADTPELLDVAKKAGAPTLTTRDQRLAAYAAVGWGMTTGRAGVLALQAGPGFANSQVGLLEGASLHQPLVVVATSNPKEGIGRGGFQEYDLTVRRSELFVWQHAVAEASELRWALRSAIASAEGSQPGPVLLSIPGDLVPELPYEPGPKFPGPTALSPDPDTVARVAEQMRDAERVVLLLGGGSKAHGAPEVYRDLAEATDAHVLVTASGRGAFSEASPRFGGLAGLYASSHARDLLRTADLVVVVGSALEETARWGWAEERQAPVVRIDRSAAVFERSSVSTMPVVGDAIATVKAILQLIPERRNRRDPLDSLRSPRPLLAAGLVSAPAFWMALRDALERASPRPFMLCQENGLADLWGYFADTFTIPDWVRTVVPGEQTAMGFGLGAALGAEASGAEVLAVAGDGAVEANLSWLLTASERHANVALVVLRNKRLGWPSLARQEDDGLTKLTSDCDLVSFAQSMGFVAQRVTSVEALLPALEQLLRSSGPRLIEVDIAGRDAIPGASDWNED